jgi:hypothetical protein
MNLKDHPSQPHHGGMPKRSLERLQQEARHKTEEQSEGQREKIVELTTGSLQLMAAAVTGG